MARRSRSVQAGDVVLVVSGSWVIYRDSLSSSQSGLLQVSGNLIISSGRAWGRGPEGTGKLLQAWALSLPARSGCAVPAATRARAGLDMNIIFISESLVARANNNDHYIVQTRSFQCKAPLRPRKRRRDRYRKKILCECPLVTVARRYGYGGAPGLAGQAVSEFVKRGGRASRRNRRPGKAFDLDDVAT